jgi:hypothetical protein
MCPIAAMANTMLYILSFSSLLQWPAMSAAMQDAACASVTEISHLRSTKKRMRMNKKRKKERKKERKKKERKKDVDTFFWGEVPLFLVY